MAITISGSGIVEANIANGAVSSDKLATGIDAIKLADGTVTSTELQYINTLSSNAQTQFEGGSFSGQRILHDAHKLTPAIGSNQDLCEIQMPRTGAVQVTIAYSGLVEGSSEEEAVKTDNIVRINATTPVVTQLSYAGVASKVSVAVTAGGLITYTALANGTQNCHCIFVIRAIASGTNASGHFETFTYARA